MSITAVTYHTMFLTIYVKALQLTGAEDTVSTLTDRNSEYDKETRGTVPPDTSHQTQLKHPALGNLLFMFSEKRDISVLFLTFRHHASYTQDRHTATPQSTLFIYSVNKYI